MQRKNIYMFGIATMLMASPALAQGQAETQAQPAPSTTQPEAAPAQPQATPQPGATEFSQADIQKFAMAALEVSKIQSDAGTPVADKPAKMVEAVQGQGLDPATFNAISEASQSDPELQQAIQAELAKAQQPSAPAQ